MSLPEQASLLKLTILLGTGLGAIVGAVLAIYQQAAWYFVLVLVLGACAGLGIGLNLKTAHWNQQP